MAEPNRMICQTQAQMDAAVEWLDSCDLIAEDIETIPHKKGNKSPWLMTVCAYSGVSNQVMRSFAFQFTHEKSAVAKPPDWLMAAHESVKAVNANAVPKTMHNGTYDCAWFLRYGLPVSNYAYDSMTLWWARYPDLPKTLDTVSSVMLDDHAYWKMGRKDQDFTAHTLYAMRDTESTLRSTIRLIEWAARDRAMMRNFVSAHLRNLAGLGMSMRGMKVDYATRESMHNDLAAAAKEKLDRLQHVFAREGINPQSPKQMQELLYDVLGAKPRNAKGRVVKRDKGSTGRIAMRAIRNEHPIFAKVIDLIEEAKEPAKQISNVIGIEFPDGRFRTSYDGIGTTTSRFSSRADAFGFGGNAQNIRKKYRKMMKADEDSFILEIDFSAADDVFVSYESEDPHKIEIVDKGLDAHSFNAANVFFTNWRYEDVVKGKKESDARVTHPIYGIRQITKKVTHGINYLMAAMTLLMSAGRDAIVAAAEHMGYENASRWSTEQLAEFCVTLDEAYRAYYTRFARTGSNSYYMDLQKELIRFGAFETIFRYKQNFSGDLRSQDVLRACAASVGQANTAGRINMAMLELEHGVRQRNFRDGPAPDIQDSVYTVSEQSHGASLRLQTHDSLTYNINYKHSRWQDGVNRILHVMRRPVLCKGRAVNVGIEADVAVNWADNAHEVSGVEEIESWLMKN